MDLRSAGDLRCERLSPSASRSRDFSGDGVPDILVVSIDDGIAGSSDNVSLLIQRR